MTATIQTAGLLEVTYEVKTCGRCRGNRIVHNFNTYCVCGRCEGTGRTPAPADHTYAAFYANFDHGHDFGTAR